MNKRISLLISLPLLLGACASEPAQPADDAPVSDADAALPRVEVALVDLQGVWTRDDDARYYLVEHAGQLIGYELDSDYFGCRIRLSKEDQSLRGGASFTTHREEPGSLLKTAWDLEVVDPKTLRGIVGAWDLDPESDEYTIPDQEERSFKKTSDLSADEVESVRAVTLVQQKIDEVLGSADPSAGVMELLSSPQVRELESNPLRDSVGDRLKALFRSLTPTSLQAGAPRSEPADPEEPEAEARTPAPAVGDFSDAWKEGSIDQLADLELAKGQGWEGELNESLGGWTFEKYTPGAEGMNDVSRFYLDTLPGDAPKTAEAYGQRLLNDADFQDFGEKYSELTSVVTLDHGFLIEGTSVETSDQSETSPAFVLAITVGRFRLLARGSTFATPALRAEAVALCKALVPLLKASSQPAAHSPNHEKEMGAFLALFTGDSAAVEKALKTFGIVGLDAKEMDYYSLGEPKIVKSDCEPDRFTFEAKAGMTIRTYVVTWKDGRIVEVESQGLR